MQATAAAAIGVLAGGLHLVRTASTALQGAAGELPPAVYAWAERLGGWAVIVWVVWWFMRRSDAQGEQLQRAVEQFSAFEHSEREAHAGISRALEAVVEESHEQALTLRGIRTSLELLERAHGMAPTRDPGERG